MFGITPPPPPPSPATPAAMEPQSSPTTATPVRQWRPAALRNLRNQWSRLLAATARWAATLAEGRSAATSLVNTYLSRRYLPAMDLGVVKEMPGIRSKASHKLSCQQELSQTKLMSSYKKMVDIISDMIKASASMRCYLKGSGNHSLIQFSNYPEDEDDLGDGGGIHVFPSWPITSFEQLAQELVEMFASELYLKRFLVLELLGISSGDDSEMQMETETLQWTSELYPGESNYLNGCLPPSKQSCKSFANKIKDWDSDMSNYRRPNRHPEQDVLQVYLTAWISDTNIVKKRVEDIFEMVERVMQVQLS